MHLAPADLSLIATRLESGSYYRSLEVFDAELMLMLRNCRAYNKPGTSYYKCGPSCRAVCVGGGCRRVRCVLTTTVLVRSGPRGDSRRLCLGESGRLPTTCSKGLLGPLQAHRLAQCCLVPRQLPAPPTPAGTRMHLRNPVRRTESNHTGDVLPVLRVPPEDVNPFV